MGFAVGIDSVAFYFNVGGSADDNDMGEKRWRTVYDKVMWMVD